ncbi:MAG: response regulator transcription factor [Crocinitomicaceae bacterium]|nr:response regulator transcription factor [Flavobacteriales bacterium]NQZ34762.1 response regulator transcription factor [Crocinitomicaceae bacterium]
MSSGKRILLVEDEENFGSLLQNYLRLSGHEVDWAKDGTLGYSTYVNGSYDVCIFDVMMPNMDGFALTEKIRARGSRTPIIFLTAKKMKEDMIKGYQVGGDDYLNKPFDIEILLLKLDAIFSRQGQGQAEKQEERYSLGNYAFEVKPRLLHFNNGTKKLSPKEGALLELLCKHLNDVTPREKALIEIWKEDTYFTTRSMDVYIAKLRKYLKADPNVMIENVHSSGYALYVRD